MSLQIQETLHFLANPNTCTDSPRLYNWVPVHLIGHQEAIAKASQIQRTL